MFRNRLRSLAGLIFAAILSCSTLSYAAPDKPNAPDTAASTAQAVTPALATADTLPTEFNIKNPYEWVQLGKNAGLPMAEIAGQLGVAGDKVLDSNSGKIAVALVGAKLLGVTAKDLGEIPYRILAFLLGIVFFVVSVRIWAKSLRHDMEMRVNAPVQEKHSDDQTLARFERSIVGCAIIPKVLFGAGLVFYSGWGIFFGTVGAVVLAIIQFVFVYAASDNAQKASASQQAASQH